ncbi:hypothetical protein LJC40_04080 [Synergistaceae bacterium OttesenSCG-928-D05]|nr:hypothetical protein [Synergistaceae bacterium OttesenSCG-928-D05]
MQTYRCRTAPARRSFRRRSVFDLEAARC